jgi:3-oxoacyl-ACP reductase-like protein
MVPPLKMKGSATMSAAPNKTTADAAKAEAAKTETPATAEAPATATPEVKADTVKARKGVQVSATVSQEFYEKWDELHWTKRMSPTDMVREAVQDYAKANGITVPAKA